MARVVIRVALLLIALCSIAASPLVAAVQIVTTDPTMDTLTPSQAFSFDVLYDVDDDNNDLPALTVRLHFDPLQVDLDLVNPYDNEIPESGFTSLYNPAQADGGNEDGNAATTGVVIVSWIDFDATPSFPNVDLTSGPVRLFTVNFNTLPGYTGTTINVTGEAANGYTFSAGNNVVLGSPATPTPTLTATITNTPTVSPTPSDTPTPTNTPTPSNTPTPTNTPTPSGTPTPTNTPTNTLTPSITPTPSNTLTPSITPSAVVPEIPTLSGRGMALMVLLLLGIAALFLARQRN